MVFQKDLDFERQWVKLLSIVEREIGKRPKDLNAVLFLIGVQELGHGAKTFSKEEKQDLMHIGVCRVLSASGFYELEGTDSEGWPHWKKIKEIPHFDLLEQEKLLKMHVLEYFQNEFNITL